MPSQSVSSKSNMKQILKEAGNTTVIAEFYADWCGNCTKIMPAYERMSQEYDDAIFLKVDVDKHDDIHPDYNVSATVSDTAKINHFLS